MVIFCQYHFGHLPKWLPTMTILVMDASTARTLNIRRLVEAAGGPTAFANKYGSGRWSQEQVSQWISVRNPKPIGGRLARDLEVELGLGHGALDRFEDSRGGSPTERVVVGGLLADEDVVLVKESEVAFKGGPGHELVYEIVEDSEPAAYQMSWFQKERLNPMRVVRFLADGESNEPFLFRGDRILVNLDETEIKNGKVYAFWQEGEGRRVKKLFKDKAGKVIIRSFNPDYPDEELSAEEAAEKISIIGRVRDKSGKGGL